MCSVLSPPHPRLRMGETKKITTVTHVIMLLYIKKVKGFYRYIQVPVSVYFHFIRFSLVGLTSSSESLKEIGPGLRGWEFESLCVKGRRMASWSCEWSLDNSKNTETSLLQPQELSSASTWVILEANLSLVKLLGENAAGWFQPGETLSENAPDSWPMDSEIIDLCCFNQLSLRSFFTQQ